jgi:hypothetical protein
METRKKGFVLEPLGVLKKKNWKRNKQQDFLLAHNSVNRFNHVFLFGFLAECKYGCGGGGTKIRLGEVVVAHTK